MCTFSMHNLAKVTNCEKVINNIKNGQSLELTFWNSKLKSED